MYAIYAADTGIECAVIAYVSTTTQSSFRCAGKVFNTPAVWSKTGSTYLYSFIIPVEKSCAQVSIRKRYDTQNALVTTVEAKGYSVGDETDCPKDTPKTVERAMRLTY